MMKKLLVLTVLLFVCCNTTDDFKNIEYQIQLLNQNFAKIEKLNNKLTELKTEFELLGYKFDKLNELKIEISRFNDNILKLLKLLEENRFYEKK